MEWSTILTEIFKVCIIPILGVLTAFIVAWIKSKINNVNAKTNNELLKSTLDTVEAIVVNAVIATNQTYVDSLKEQNAFDAEAQKKAFQKTYDVVMASLTEDTKNGLTKLTTDLNLYITEMIEAKTKQLKKGE
jgi:hypothetical protein